MNDSSKMRSFGFVIKLQAKAIISFSPPLKEVMLHCSRFSIFKYSLISFIFLSISSLVRFLFSNGKAKFSITVSYTKFTSTLSKTTEISPLFPSNKTCSF